MTVLRRLLFYAPGPFLTESDEGECEPSIADIIQQYYERHGYSPGSAIALTRRYIRSWIVDRKEESLGVSDEEQHYRNLVSAYESALEGVRDALSDADWVVRSRMGGGK